MEEHLHMLGEIPTASPLLGITSRMPKDAGKDLIWCETQVTYTAGIFCCEAFVCHFFSFMLIFRAITSIFCFHLCCVFNDSVTLVENFFLNIIKVLNLHFNTGVITVKFDQQFACHFTLYWAILEKQHPFRPVIHFVPITNTAQNVVIYQSLRKIEIYCLLDGINVSFKCILHANVKLLLYRKSNLKISTTQSNIVIFPGTEISKPLNYLKCGGFPPKKKHIKRKRGKRWKCAAMLKIKAEKPH